MPKVEIDEAEYAALKQVAGFQQAALSNKKAREHIMRAQKIVHPEIAVPEIDAPEAVLGEVGKLAETVSALTKRLDDDAAARREAEQKAEIDRRIAEGRNAAHKAGYVGDTLAALEKLMTDEGIASYEAGMALYEKRNPVAEVVTPRAGRFEIMQPNLNPANDLVKDFFTGKISEQQYDANAIAAAIKEARSAA